MRNIKVVALAGLLLLSSVNSMAYTMCDLNGGNCRDTAAKCNVDGSNCRMPNEICDIDGTHCRAM